MMSRNRWILALVSLVVVASVVTMFLVARGTLTLMAPRAEMPSYEDLTGSLFRLSPQHPFGPPGVQDIALPALHDGACVWGAIGRDPNGNIWVGVSAEAPGESAYLLQFDPETGAWHDRGTAVDQLKAAGLYRQGEGQNKIHSKIVPGADGWLYFASTDEEGETDKTLPRWGGHLWRTKPDTQRWQHVLAVPEGLLAVSGVGRYIYVLGYWDHVLYQYDTVTGKNKRVVVGSTAGHVSRNFLADARGRAYVPRLVAQAGGTVAATLVEYDSELREVAATPLDNYLGTHSPQAHHGIVGLVYLADGRMLFTTHRGQLYMIQPRVDLPALVTAVGWFHPDGEAYAPSLFALGADGLVAGVTERNGRHEWVVMELATRISGAFPLDTKGLRSVLLYGSVNRDRAGRAYVGGWASSASGATRPLMLQIDPGQ
jgi:hypothetical protein